MDRLQGCPARHVHADGSCGTRRGFHTATDIGASRDFVVHAGEDRFLVSATMEGVGARALAEKLRGSHRGLAFARAVRRRGRNSRRLARA